MKTRTRLAIEALEARWCPAVTANLAGTILTVVGSAEPGEVISVVRESSDPGRVNVAIGTSAVAGPFSGVGSIRFVLTDADDQVLIDLGGRRMAGGITVLLGGGADSVSVVNGVLGGGLSVASETEAIGRARAVLLEAGRPVNVPAAVFNNILNAHLGSLASSIFLPIQPPGGGGGDAEPPPARIDLHPDEVTVAEGATVGGLGVRLMEAGGTVLVAGDVTGNVTVDATARSSSDGSSVTVAGEVDGSLRFMGSQAGDELIVGDTGSVDKGIIGFLNGGADTVTVNGRVTGGLMLDTGAGDDIVVIDNLIGGRTTINTGLDDDTFTATADADFLGAATISLGAGDDNVTIDDGADFTSLTLNGGTGLDLFAGNRTRRGLRLVSF